MTTLEDQVRRTLHDMAEEVRPVALLERLEPTAPHVVRRHRLALVSVAAALVAAVTAASVLVQRIEGPSIVEPVQRPPKVFRLGDVATTAPGRALMAITLARPNATASDGEDDDPLYLLPSTGAAAVRLPGSDRVPYSASSALSTDGTRLIRQGVSDASAVARLEVVNLLTGATNRLGDELGFCPQLSPDNRTVAFYSDVRERFELLDVRSAAVRPGPREPGLGSGSSYWYGGGCTGFGWSPDGQSLSTPGGDYSIVTARSGRIMDRLPDRRAVNSSMAWSPDGRQILLYVETTGRFVVRDLADGGESGLEPPDDALRPLGWTGARVVWLAGQPGDYRLLTTDQRGEDVRTWMRFDIGNRPIATISWSSALSGTSDG